MHFAREEALTALKTRDYARAALLYHQLSQQENGVKADTWYQGLSLLLQGQEAEAQMTWMLGMMEGDETEQAQWSDELIAILKAEVKRQEADEDQALAWVICQHIREINPDDIQNLLKLLQLFSDLQCSDLEESGAEEADLNGLLEHLRLNLGMALEAKQIDIDAIVEVLKKVLEKNCYAPWSLKFAELVAEIVVDYRDQITNQNQVIYILMKTAMVAAYSGHCFELALQYAQLCLRINPQEFEVLSHTIDFYHELGQLQKAIERAENLYQIAKTLPEQIHANALMLRVLLRSGGQWQAAIPKIAHQKVLFETFLNQDQVQFDRQTFSRLSNCSFFLPYTLDDPAGNRSWQNAILALCQQGVRAYAQAQFQEIQQQIQRRNISAVQSSKKPLRIGYLSHCLRRHSVGWLARWLLEYHDRDQFEIYGYFVTYRADVQDWLQDWYVQQCHEARKLGQDGLEVAEQIHQDQIDILVDLDSITADITCEAVALKPAPIQVTWLGWDASGIPEIDYYLADPYVLPETAQNYYSETLWRLPQTYIAVDGFETGTPTLRRQDLEIPDDAIVYFSAQSGYKRHPDNVHLQMKILQAVPNSYFLIKDITIETETVQTFFEQVAEEEGVQIDRLRFLPKVSSETVHRANLSIADVVLDTYPYNGATTTLETLWVGVPVVTLVGKQFSARNSYTMMVNAGITEGIAWSPEEYVEWGIRLGTEEGLRQQVAWKLRQARRTAPLWNARQFTQDVEAAYQQMWQKFTG
jgi:predicted O-linked N-acetylglucosamine transferase (SPINDLY family)